MPLKSHHEMCVLIDQSDAKKDFFDYKFVASRLNIDI